LADDLEFENLDEFPQGEEKKQTDEERKPASELSFSDTDEEFDLSEEKDLFPQQEKVKKQYVPDSEEVRTHITSPKSLLEDFDRERTRQGFVGQRKRSRAFQILMQKVVNGDVRLDK
jgi:hypothetical protein